MKDAAGGPAAGEQSGLQAGLLGCHGCGLLTAQNDQADQRCRRCGEPLHTRRPNSLALTWALLLTAIVFYIPANLFPITVMTALGNKEGDTIMQGVLYFLGSGEWPIALVIFTASILVPTLKITALTYLLISVQRNHKTQHLGRTKIYRAVEFVGRWSMIDVFVVTIMVALVQMGTLVSAAAGTGAIYFCAVVIITMLAAESFDPRLIWDGPDTHE